MISETQGITFSLCCFKKWEMKFYFNDLKDDVLIYNNLERLFNNHNGGWFFCFYVKDDDSFKE